ncbi:MAG: hypothetical protein JWO89_2228, partial [Verrucomicrobiaceae bacterium]|nr:hypothetical protein [Verrucomicrobiaceae bacterium]
MKTLPRRLAVVLGLFTLLSSPGLSAAEIHDAADTGDVAVIEKLIGADSTAVNLKDKAGDLQLHHAVQKGQAKSVT